MPFRDTYWNIPAWGPTALYITQFLAVAILLGRLYMRSRLWQAGDGKLHFDHFGERLGRVGKHVLLQLRIARENYSALMHVSIFVAFIFLFIGTALATLDYDVWHLVLDAKLLQGEFYLVYEIVLDFVTIAAIIGFGLALWRRYAKRPVKLTYSVGFQAMLWILFIDLLSGLFLEGLRLAAVQPEWRFWSFAGYGVSRLILLLNPSQAMLETAHRITWFGHASITALIYLVFLDLPTKHILYSPLNIFFTHTRPAGQLSMLDLEDESKETFGVGSILEFRPYQLLTADACTECGRCQVVCPAWAAGTPLNPKEVVLDVQHGIDLYRMQMLAQSNGGNGHAVEEMPVTSTLVSEEALWACTSCRACVYECPVLIDQLDLIVDMRRHLTLMEGSFPDQLGNAMTQAERAGNPWGNPRGSRMDWAQGLTVPIMADKKKADVLYWLGCAGSYDPESQKTARAMIKIFEAAGIDYAVLGNEERCNCEWARRAGNEALYQDASHSNIATFDKYEFHTIITHCPHCFNTFKNEYPQFGGSYDVMHHSQYVEQLIDNGHLKLTKKLNDMLTYHDSCYLGRYNGVYDAPREVISDTGINIVEMARSREKGFCCGGGGAQVWFESHQPNPVNEIRLEEAMSTGADTIGTACPFCTIMLSSAVQSKGVSEQVAVKDFALLVAEALE
jgi:Fe-S oxidoreductase